MLALNRSLLNKEYTLLNALKALAPIISMCTLHAILLSENYTEMLYMIDEGDVPSVQCNMNLNGSVREIDGFSLIFIDVSIPALTPRLNSTETSL
jgi:hypothetical protein